MSGAAEPSIGWAAGVDHGLVWPGGCALIEGSLPVSTAAAVWSRMEPTGDLWSFLQALTNLSGGSLLNLPGFAVVLFGDAGAHAAVRGPFEVMVASGPQWERYTAEGVTTWTERHLGTIHEVSLTSVRGDLPGEPADAAPGRPLASGVVPAGQLTWRCGVGANETSLGSDAATLWSEPGLPQDPSTVDVPGDVPEPHPQRDGVPQPELSGRPEPALDDPAGLADHDGQTIIRGMPVRQVRAGATGALEGVLCVAGHVNPPGRPRCRACEGPMSDRRTSVALGVPIGWLRSSSGQSLELTGTIIVGRQPMASRIEGQRMPALLAVAFGHVSGTHLEIRVDGWAVYARDLNSTNGTFLHRGQEPPRRVPTDPLRLAAGDVLDLGHGVRLTLPDMA